jgi:hypothetical protein
MGRRLYRWIEIGGWTLKDACAAGELRALCPRPGCEYAVRNFRLSSAPGAARLYEVARRMKCTGCARKGAHFEIWSVQPIGARATRSDPR